MSGGAAQRAAAHRLGASGSARPWRGPTTLAVLGALVAAAVVSMSASVSLAGEAELEARYRRLAAELRCLVCQNQSLADSNAGLALDLKQQLRQQLEAGRSDREVIDFMTQRYGDFVLYRPPMKATTLLLWGGPVLMLLGGGLLLWRSLAASAPEPPPAAPGGPAAR